MSGLSWNFLTVLRCLFLSVEEEGQIDVLLTDNPIANEAEVWKFVKLLCENKLGKYSTTLLVLQTLQ